MRLRLLVLICFSFFSFFAAAQKYLEMIEAGTYTLQEIQLEAEAYFDIVGRERGTGYKPYKRWEYVAQMELDESGVKISNFELAKRARDYRQTEQLQRSESSGFAGDWKQLGPTYWNATSAWSPGVGRVTSIGIDENNTNHLIVGSPTGGVWKTLNGGNTWVNLTDFYSTVDVYSLEISPYDANHYLWGSTGGKIFRTTDGGASWTSTSNVSGSGKVIRMLFHPTDPNVVYAVSETNGLFRSVNGGNSWSAVSGASGVPGYDVEFKPGDTNTIYFSGILVYRSIDGGNSFNQITGFGTANNNYKMMGVSPANPSIVYVLESNGGKFGAFYKSTDSGANYTKLVDGSTINYFGYSSTGDDDRGQAPRDMDVAVNPFDAFEVHIAGIHTWKSVDGGVSFALTSHWMPSTAASLGVGYNHADIDILKFAGNTLYVGSDGGMYISNDGAQTFIDRSTGLGIREFYKIGVSKTDPNVVTGGSQDNGTGVMRGPNRQWVDWLGADGMETFVDWNNANTLYGTSQYGSMYRSTNQGNSRSSISKPPDVEDGAWVTPFEQDPQVANTIYVAFEDVWKSSNNGSVWTKISDFADGNMNQMKLAPSDNQRIYVSRGSSLFTTANGGGAWVTTPKTWGNSTINYISVHPSNPQRVLIVTASGVYHSIDAGNNWTSIGTGLPSGTKYCATWENTPENGIYVGGFGFVAYTNDDLGGQWVGFFEGLPNVRVYELEINYVSNTIFAGTYGRGLWESPLYKLLPPNAAFVADKREGCRELTVTFTDKSGNNPSAWDWSFEGGTPASSNLQHPTVTFTGSGDFKVTLKASNDAGENTVEEVNYITLYDPSEPVVPNAERCEAGELVFDGTGHSGEQLNWYASDSAAVPLFTGDVFIANISQTTTYFASTGTEYFSSDFVGPISNSFGSGGDHAGGYFLIMDVEKAVLLKSATVYAVGAANRTFQLRDANGTVLLEKTVFVNDGESRVQLNMDIPQGTDLQIGCISPANLYRNSSGVNYPYSLNGLVQIKSSTAGLDYYYYLYNIELEIKALCESARVPVTGVVHFTPSAPSISASGPTVLCPSESVVLTAENVCPGCTVKWSNGETGPSISVATAGEYTATVNNPLTTCGDSPVSNPISVTTVSPPAAATLSASGPTLLCPGANVELNLETTCPDCNVLWSNGETTSSITVNAAGIYTAILSNVCGESPASNAISVTTGTAPEAAIVSASGASQLCPSETVLLTAGNSCPDCNILWSNGETSSSIIVNAAGNYTAILNNVCGESPASNAISVTTATTPEAAIVSTSGATQLCPGETVLLTAGNICPDCNILWSNGETSSSITVGTEGIYTLSLSNVCGDSPASNAIAVTIGALPDAPILSASGSTTLCPGESVLLSVDNVCPDCLVNWSNGETSSSILVSEAGVFSATLNNVCGSSSASSQIQVTTQSVPNAPVISPSGLIVLCPAESIELVATNDQCPDCPILWSNGETGPSITVFEPGTYTANTVNINNLCGNSAVSNEVFVSIQPPFVPSVQVGNVCELSTIAGSDYQWFFNGMEIPGATGQSWTAQATGLYSVTMNNAEGCSGDSGPIFVEACVSNTHELEGVLSARVYPNPAQDRVLLDLQLGQSTQVVFDLYQADGKLVGRLYEGMVLLGGQLFELALPDLPNGVYHYRLSTAYGAVHGNLVVQRR